jgi:hypothetical protein
MEIDDDINDNDNDDGGGSDDGVRWKLTHYFANL